MSNMRVPSVKNNPDKIQLSRISHVSFEHPDLDAFSSFADAFGFVEAGRESETVYFRGYGKDQYVYVATKSANGAKRFKGAAFVAASEGDFDKAAKLPDARVSELTAPGGGRLVTIERPGPTYLHVLYGQKEREVPGEPVTATHEHQGSYNGALEKIRKGVNSFPLDLWDVSADGTSRRISTVPRGSGAGAQVGPLRLCDQRLRLGG